MQHGGFCGQHGGFCGQHGGFCGRLGGFCGQHGDLGWQHGDLGWQHELHFGWSHIFWSFEGPRKKKRTFSEGKLVAALISPSLTPTCIHVTVKTKTRLEGSVGHFRGHKSVLPFCGFPCVSVLVSPQVIIFQIEMERSEHVRKLPKIS